MSFPHAAKRLLTGAGIVTATVMALALPAAAHVTIDTAKLYFKALQTYTDHSGKTSVVRWIDMPSGGAEPEHPAPSLTLAKASAPQAAPVVKKSRNGTGTLLGVAGLVAGLLALGIAIAALRRSGRSVGA
ncbi:DUF1775 domain-containing protein [Actinoallomurus sp. NPDC052274]|uniref:DUF1775 domain-containing protein n=1 Tax=Actinoallomurus sp. NPDC052274 TaxID=3155420 RepID=UPI00342E45B6